MSRSETLAMSQIARSANSSMATAAVTLLDKWRKAADGEEPAQGSAVGAGKLAPGASRKQAAPERP
jgi:hypothetical protein